MARPSLKEARTQEILDAFIQCVARYGVDGSTTEKISEVAGVGRPLLRHYLGNRNEMVEKLLAHVVARFTALTDNLADGLPAENRVEALMDRLFEKKSYSSENAAVFQALVAVSDRYEDIGKFLMQFIVRFEKMVLSEVMRANPDVDKAKCKIVASGISAIYFNMDAIMPLGPTRGWRTGQKSAALLLLKSL